MVDVGETRVHAAGGSGGAQGSRELTSVLLKTWDQSSHSFRVQALLVKNPVPAAKCTLPDTSPTATLLFRQHWQHLLQEAPLDFPKLD